MKAHQYPHLRQHFPINFEGYSHLIYGEYRWWPIHVLWKDKPWPSEVPILAPSNFYVPSEGAEYGPDVRIFEEWLEGFPGSKRKKVIAELFHAAEVISDLLPCIGHRWGGNYTIDMWASKQSSEVLAEVWNLAMANLGYTEDAV